MRENPWASIGVAAGVGFFMGYLIGRRMNFMPDQHRGSLFASLKALVATMVAVGHNRLELCC